MEEMIKIIADKVKHEEWINDGDDEWWAKLIEAIVVAAIEAKTEYLQ